MPFRHADRSHRLETRIELEVRERLEEAIDHVCLEALVQRRRAQGLPPPAADSAADRGEYTAHVATLLARLDAAMSAALDGEQRRRLATLADPRDDESARLMRVQVTLARLLPDYWQRFEAVSTRYLAEPGQGDGSGREGRGLLARLFGRG
jgi:hypothetical protein